MQDSDIEDLLETHGHFSAKMASTSHNSKHSASSYGSLVDSLQRTGRKVSVTGIDDHELPAIDILT